MTVGVLKLVLLILEARSLKDKRRVLQHVKAKLRQDFNVSVAETGSHDKWQKSDLTIAAVGNDRRGTERLLSRIVERFRKNPVPELVDYEIELF